MKNNKNRYAIEYAIECHFPLFYTIYWGNGKKERD